MDFSDGPATLFSREVKLKSPSVSRASIFKIGGGGGN
jgi:hypothetical protein